MMHPRQNSALSANALSIGYDLGPSRHVIASDLDLSLQGGEFVCLLGPNGAGKSTLIRTLAGMQAPIGGEILFAGTDHRSIPSRELARHVSVVLTETAAIGMMDAYTMVSLGRHPYSGWFGSLNAHDRQRIDWSMRAVGADNLSKRQVTELSDGERQKISIARALAQETRIMLLDEPTAYLDLPRRVELMSILRDLAHRENIGLLLSTHDLDLALRFADRLWVLTPEGTLIKGYPEAIAMSREFADAFKSERLDWEPAIGGFRPHSDPCLNIQIEGAGIERIWTQRAMERLGFGIAEQSAGTNAFSITVKRNSWKLQRGGDQKEFFDIESLIDWIRHQDWTV